ncbi:MAG TPA: selenocysteine-specific translation elongation factor, partial [bacterium]|nr:selenocysteine-specific translation elongation factor [bacterium]
MERRPPGLLSHDEEAEVLLMIGTAGHVDHGKTRLVGLLTGCETDRLKVEKERGLSIELGFAPCSLGGGLAAGIVDVPGHEQFIKNMVAGAAGMDMTVLVVAADDGVMPQTIEHLQIMEFLGVRLGMVVITKVDLVTPERVQEVREEIELLVDGTFLEGAPVCPFSAETLEGFDLFYNTIVELATRAKIERLQGVFRMPVERVFSLAGHGTVLSGIPLAGTISVGDEVQIQPSGAMARVRSMERFGHEAERGGAGQCLALNLAGLPRDGAQRGNVVTRPGYVHPTSFLQIRLTTCHDLRAPLRHGEEIRFHTGTLEAHGRLGLYGCESVGKRETVLASLQLNDAAGVAPTDRFVIRRHSPAITVAGGVVVSAMAEKPKMSRVKQFEHLSEKWACFGSLVSKAEFHFVESGSEGSTVAETALALLVEKSDAQQLVAQLAAKGSLTACNDGDRYLHTKGMDEGREQVLRYLSQFLEKQSSSYGPTFRELTDGLGIPEPSLMVILDSLVRSGAAERREGRIGLPGREKQFDGAQKDLLDEIEKT